VFVKMAAETVATRLMGEMGRLAQTETRFYSQLAPELTGVPAPPHTVMHGDAHPGNVYFRNGAAGLLDWRPSVAGIPAANWHTRWSPA
jgi:aminoglycoside phosphotransferase (APT) family kinase protein